VGTALINFIASMHDTATESIPTDANDQYWQKYLLVRMWSATIRFTSSKTLYQNNREKIPA
jgi:hypothetical protein